MHFQLYLKPERAFRQVRHRFSVVTGVLIAVFLVLFCMLSLMGGPVAALFYTPLCWGGIFLLLLLFNIPGSSKVAAAPDVSEAASSSISIGEEGIQAAFAPFTIPVPWQEIGNVMLRYGTLTITFRNNRMHQYAVMPGAVDARELELFCAACILRSNGRTQTADPLPDVLPAEF